MVALEAVLTATIQQVILVYTSLAVSITLGIPLAVVALNSHKLEKIIITFANLVQAIPTFAVVAIVVPLMGIGFWPAIFAIMLRALLPIVKNTWIGLSSVDPASIDAATGLGLTRWQTTRFIRFPHAYPPMFAGIKFAAILANSVAILTAIIGSGGLGTLVFEGLAGINITTMLAGALPAIFIAIFLDVSFTRLEYRLTAGR
ncbi:ABC transporter permease [Methanogenium marinum]|uniref:ABC transporter permease n=1 Tax=Methanogenium marinum TaxID=348610 RepID=A0A9Q4PV67_9EURY|nr:ABC transporter permease [Methanogenium marinum]MDE4907675.1 ABC transporter permease [Methanogenium marinum]